MSDVHRVFGVAGDIRRVLANEDEDIGQESIFAVTL